MKFLNQLLKQFIQVKNAPYQNSRQTFIIFQAILAAVFIFPFFILRIVQEQWLHAIIDIGIVLTLGFLGLLALSGRYINQIAWFLVVAYTSAVWLVVSLFDSYTLYWAFVIGMATHFILRQKEALVMNLILLLGALWFGRDFEVEILFNFTLIYLLAIVLTSQFSNRMNSDNQSLHLLATRDVLTGSGNRLALDEAIMQVFERNDQQPHTLLMLDIDHFKIINDTYGHVVGDNALKNLVDSIQQVCEDNAKIYRYGGEEFCILLFKDLQESQIIAEKIRQTIADTSLIPEKNITISIGLADLASSENARDWFIKADSALYQAKKLGRNRVCEHQSSSLAI